jgi:Zn-dependent M28 family amino/carboxypeptidase
MRLLSLAILGALCAGGSAWAYEPSAEAMRGHIAFLASDALEGRAAGTPGYDKAAAYVADQFKAIKLKPAGDAGTYLQAVPLVSYAPAEQGSVTLVDADGKTAPLAFGADFLPGTTPLEARTALEAPLVFVGWGLVTPQRDDYAGLDVKGKIVVFLAGAPSGLQTEERAHFSSGAVKRGEAAKRGAVGAVSIYTPEREKIFAFAKGVDYWREPSMTWRRKDGRPDFDGGNVRPLAALSLAGAGKLFDDAPTSLDAIYAEAAKPDGAPKGFALNRRARVSLRNAISDVRSANVAGLIEGADPKLKGEYVVLTAHLDHVGVDKTIKGDGLHNGAMDNAAGVATMLEAARAFAAAPNRPKRSVLFLAVTAEERGLVGADYFAQNPTVPKAGLAANVNLDMPVLTYSFQDVIAFGADRSTMGEAVARAAARAGVKLSPDPMPQEGLFTRSDHYRFVEQGVPAVFLMTGFANGGDKAFPAFLASHYHKPSDDLNLPIDYQAGARFAQVNYEIARELADAPERPRWKAGDFFGRTFGGAKEALGA